MSTFITIADYIIVLLFITGIGLQVSKTYAEIQYQRKVEGTLFKAIRKVSNKPSISFNGMWFGISFTILVLWTLEHYGIEYSFKLILFTNIAYLVVGTVLTITELVLRLLKR